MNWNCSLGCRVQRAAVGLVVGALGLVGSTSAKAETVVLWEGTEQVEVEVAQLAAMPSLYPAQAQNHLNINGFGAFDFSGYHGGSPDCHWALLFSHPNASGAPILATSLAMGESESSHFWTFLTGGLNSRVIPDWYLLWAPDLPELPDFEALLADLGIEGQVIATEWEYYVISEARSGVQIVDEVDRLHQALGPALYSEYGSYGCPSGGGGGGGGGPLGPLEIPSLSDLSMLFFAAVLAAAGVARTRG